MSTVGRALLVACAALLGCSAAGAGDGGEEAPPPNDDLEVPPNDGESAVCKEAAALRTSVGCDYYATMMDAGFAADNGCFVSFVANTSNERAKIRVTFGDEEIDLSRYAKIPQGAGLALGYADFDPAVGLAEGEVAILFLAGNYGPLDEGEIPAQSPVRCPVPAAVPAGAQIHGTGIGQGFHITTTTPVVAYQMLPYGGGAAAVTGATLLLPASAWDQSYVAVNAYGADMNAEFGVGPSMTIVAAADDTHVTLVPKVFLGPGAGVTAAAAGSKATYTLAAGQTLQLTQAEELTGSPIQADKPVGLFAGHQCTNTPANSPYCDHAEQQIPTVRALGHEYATVAHRQRTTIAEQPIYRLIGAVDGTVLDWEPAIGGPVTLEFGQVIELTATQPFVVRSQDAEHPFLLLSYMTGATAVGAPGPRGQGYGDPDVVRVVPPAQFLERYVFFTDPTYPETNLVFVRKRGDGGFADVVVDCAGTLGGWTPLGTGGAYEYTRLDLVRHAFEPQGGCNNGRHEASSEAPFGLWVWGWGTPESQPGTADGCMQDQPGYSCYVSYGYPAGEGLQILNDAEVPVPE
jgi:IgGFc binding protein